MVAVDPYALLTREIKPYTLRNIDDITKEAKMIYSMTSEKKKNWAKVKAKGGVQTFNLSTISVIKHYHCPYKPQNANETSSLC